MDPRIFKNDLRFCQAGSGEHQTCTREVASILASNWSPVALCHLHYEVYRARGQLELTHARHLVRGPRGEHWLIQDLE